MEFTSRDLRLVAAIDRHRHFGRAAEALHISQPALSRALKSLEERLGESLFLRSRAGVDPTEVGQLVAARGGRLLAELSDLEQDVARARDGGLGELSVAVGHYPAELSVAEAVGRLLESRPRLNFSLRTYEWVAIANSLTRREVDLAFCETSPFENDPKFHVTPVGSHPVFFFARRKHPLAGRPAVGLKELFEFPWAASVIPWRAAASFRDIGDDCPAGTLDLVRQLFVPRVAATSMFLAKQIVENSDCLAISTLSQLDDDLQRGNLTLLGVRANWLHLRYGFVRLANRPPSRAGRDFMACIDDAEERLREREAALRDRYWGSRPLVQD